VPPDCEYDTDTPQGAYPLDPDEPWAVGGQAVGTMTSSTIDRDDHRGWLPEFGLITDFLIEDHGITQVRLYK
jgi:hypothetical protein